MPRLTAYFHGQPGSPGELALFGGAIPQDWWVPDRRLAGGTFADHIAALAAELRVRAAGRPVRLVGFSLGAFVALAVAARLPDVALDISLISAAGPLGDGAVLAAMAGGALFAMARQRPALFRLVARGQAWAARLVPGLLAGALFRTAGGVDQGLWRRAAFRSAMTDNLRQGLGRAAGAYAEEIVAYVGDWEALAAAVTHPVQLWHGGADSWSPPMLAARLAQLLPAASAPTVLPGLGHYTTLEAWLAAAES